MEAGLLSLIGFAVVMYITPGPNNAMVAASAANHGWRATTPHMLGITFGFALMLVVVAAGLGSVLFAVPGLATAMRYVGAAWMALIAWKIATAPPPRHAATRPLMGFTGAMAFQWVNPKAWLIGVGLTSQFLRPDEPLGGQLLRVFLVFLVVGVPCILPWALLGDGAARLLRSPARLHGFNIAMALLLLASLVPVLAGQ